MAARGFCRFRCRFGCRFGGRCSRSRPSRSQISARQHGANAIRCRPDHSSDELLSIRSRFVVDSARCPRALRGPRWSASPRHRGRIDTRARDSRAAESTTPGLSIRLSIPPDSRRLGLTVPAVPGTVISRNCAKFRNQRRAPPRGIEAGTCPRDPCGSLRARNPLRARKSPAQRASLRAWRRPPTCTDPLAEMDVLGVCELAAGSSTALATTRSEPAAVLAHRNLTRTQRDPLGPVADDRLGQGQVAARPGRRATSSRAPTEVAHPLDPRDRAAAAGRRDGLAHPSEASQVVAVCRLREPRGPGPLTDPR